MLLVVAQREIVTDHINVVNRAGLKVRAVDSSPLALLRAFPSDSTGLEVIVSIGAQLVVVAVRQGVTPRFLRTVTRGDQSFAGARREGAGAEASSTAAGKPGGTTATIAKLDPTVEEVRGSLEYFLSYDHGAQLEGLALTGGGALDPGLPGRFAKVLGMPVKMAHVALQYDAASLDLTDVQLEEASSRWGAAVGLALWGTVGAPAISLVPAEIRERRQYHRALTVSAAGLGVIAVALGGVSYTRVQAASGVAAQVNSENAVATGLQATITRYEPYVAVRTDLEARRTLAAQALQGDIDWVGIINRIDAALPPGVTISSMDLSRTGTSTGTSTAEVKAVGSADDLGQITMSLTTNGGAPSVAQFVRQMWSVPGLYGLWVSGTSGGQDQTGSAGTTFTATANVTTAALSDRAANLPGGQR